MKAKALLRNLLLLKSRIEFIKINLQNRTYANRAYFNKVTCEPLAYKNLGEEFLTSAERYGDRTALIAREENLSLTYAESFKAAQNLTQQLKELGLKRGEHLGIWAPNSSQWLITSIAAALGGYPLVCLNTALQAPELAYALKKAKIKMLITMDAYGRLEFGKILNELLQKGGCGEFPNLNLIIMKNLNTGLIAQKECINFDDLLAKPASSQSILKLHEQLSSISPESVANLLFTSGTTGQPKAAMLSHFNLVNEANYLGKSMMLSSTKPQTICFILPLFHVFGLAVMQSAYLNGCTLVMPSATYNANAALDAIEDERCQVILGTPTMFVDLIEQQRLRPRCIESLQLGLTGGAACSPEVYTQAKEKFGLNVMRIAYGATETSGAIFSQNGTESQAQSLNSVGQLYEHLEAKVINEQGETVEFGASGELCVRGFTVMKGYYDDEAKTAEVLSSDGWLRVGDEFVLDADGVGQVVGRKKDMIVRGGEKIYPKEVEDILDTHPSILEAQIIGVPDKRLGEETCAYLRLKSGAALLEEAEVKEFCKGKLAYFKIPRYVRIVQDFPKTTTGKIQKFRLKEIFANEIKKN